MLQKIINRVLKKRHFWRDVGFSELSELFLSTKSVIIVGFLGAALATALVTTERFKALDSR